MSESGGDDAPEPDRPEESKPSKRRLADKVRTAIGQAIEQGRREIADRLNLCHQAIIDDDLNFPQKRRLDERRRDRGK